MGLIPFALIYGEAARDMWLTLIETVSMSLTIFLGSAQLVFLRLRDAGVSVFVLALTVSAVNLRLLIYGSSFSLTWGLLALSSWGW
jgi:predicted branched-subunit amino acid permease